MRDLSMEELGHVYGAGHGPTKKCRHKNGSKSHSRSRSRSRSRSHSKSKRHNKKKCY